MCTCVYISTHIWPAPCANLYSSLTRTKAPSSGCLQADLCFFILLWVYPRRRREPPRVSHPQDGEEGARSDRREPGLFPEATWRLTCVGVWWVHYPFFFFCLTIILFPPTSFVRTYAFLLQQQHTWCHSRCMDISRILLVHKHSCRYHLWRRCNAVNGARRCATVTQSQVKRGWKGYCTRGSPGLFVS